MALTEDQQLEVYHNVGMLGGINHQTGMGQGITREEGRLTRLTILAELAKMNGKEVKMTVEDRKALARDVIAGITDTEEWSELTQGLSDEELNAIAEGVNDALHRRLEQ